MLLWYTIEFAHMALRLVPKVLNSIDVIALVRKELGMIDAIVLKTSNIKRIIATPSVRINDAIRHDFTYDYRT